MVGLGASGRAAVKLALARGADVVALDSNPSCLPLEVRLFIILSDFSYYFILWLEAKLVKIACCILEECEVGQCV